MPEPLHKRVRAGSEKARIWAICDELYAQRGEAPTGSEVADRYAATGGNRGTGFTQFSHWKKALGAAETRQAAPSAPGNVDPVALAISGDGVVKLPGAVLEAMALDGDGRVTALVEDGELRIIAPRAAVLKLQRELAPLRKPGESVVDELIADRRAEAARELDRE